MSLKMCDSIHLSIWRSIQYTRTCVQLYIAKIALHKMLQHVTVCYVMSIHKDEGKTVSGGRSHFWYDSAWASGHVYAALSGIEWCPQLVIHSINRAAVHASHVA